MKIFNDLPAPELDPRKSKVDEAQKVDRAPAVSGGSSEPGDQVSISARGQLLADLSSRAENAPVAPSERLAAIERAVSEGRYAFSPEVVADRLLKSLQAHPTGI